MKTTLNKIKKHTPCKDGWVRQLKHLGKKKSDDEPLAITTILDSNGLDDALWCLRAVNGHERKTRLFAVWCARQVQHLMTDPRSIAALDVAERFANGQNTKNNLDAAEAAAWAATGAAARAAARAAASSAAGAAAKDAAWAAARDAAGAAAWAAARDATRDVAWAAARDAAGAAARAAQEVEFRRICNATTGELFTCTAQNGQAKTNAKHWCVRLKPRMA